VKRPSATRAKASDKTIHRRRNARLVASLGCAAFALMTGLPPVASAAPATATATATAKATTTATARTTITGVTVTPAAPAVGAQVTTKISFCVPNGATASRAFSVRLAPELTDLPTRLELIDSAGGVDGTVTIAPGRPAVATFALNAYVNTHRNVCGTATVHSNFSGILAPPKVTTPLTFTDDNGVRHTAKIRPTGTSSSDYDRSYGAFTTADQGRTAGKDSLAWHLISKAGPLAGDHITGRIGPGQTIDCSSITVYDSTLVGQIYVHKSTNTAATAAAHAGCTATGLAFNSGPVPAGDLLDVRYLAHVTAPNGDNGSHTFKNSFSDTVTTASGTVQNFANTASIVQASGGVKISGDAVTTARNSTAGGVALGKSAPADAGSWMPALLGGGIALAAVGVGVALRRR
jgi:hypothetical protein